MLGTTHWMTPTDPAPLCSTTRSLVVVTEPNVTALNVLSAIGYVPGLGTSHERAAVPVLRGPRRGQPHPAAVIQEVDRAAVGRDRLVPVRLDPLLAGLPGRRVPEDVALVGYDNWDIFAGTTRPPLTSVDMCLKELGRLAARELLDAIDGRPSHGLRRLPCRLVIRESTGPVRRPAPDTPAPGPAPPHGPGPPPGTAAAPAAS